MPGFDLNALFSNPQFMAGAGMLGGNQVMEPLKLMQEMQQAKINQEYKQQALAMEQARTHLYEQQTKTAEHRAQIDEAKHAALLKMAQGFMAPQAQPQQALQQGMLNAPQQPQLPQGNPALADTSAARAAPDKEPTAQQAALMRHQDDLAAIDAEIKRAPTPEARDIMKQERDKIVQRGNFVAQIPPTAPVADPFAAYKQAQMQSGLARLMFDDTGGLKDMAEAQKPNILSPGQVIMGPNGQQQTVPDPKGDAQIAQGQAHVDISRGHLDVDRSKLKTEQDKEARLADEAKMKKQEQLAKDESAYTQTTTTADRAIKLTDDVLNGALKDVTGANSLTNALAIPGRPARTTLNNITELKAKLVNDTLQNIRAATKNGASGYGSFTEKELQVVEKEIASIDLSSDIDTVKNKLKIVRDTMQEWKDRAGKLYTGSTGKPPPSAADQPISLDEYMRRMRGEK